MTVLVTSESDLIGSSFVLKWRTDFGENLLNLDLPTYAGNVANLDSVFGDPRHQFVRVDIGNCDLVAALLPRQSPRAVIYFASEAPFDRSIGGLPDLLKANVNCTLYLLEGALPYWAQLHYNLLHSSPYFFDRHDRRLLPASDRYTNCVPRLPLRLDDDNGAVVTEAVIESLAA